MRLKRAIEDALANRHKLADKLAARPLPRTRAAAFPIVPDVLVDNQRVQPLHGDRGERTGPAGTAQRAGACARSSPR